MPRRPATRSRWYGRFAVLVLCCLALPRAVHADSDQEAAERAAREIQAARDHANDVAQQLFDAESRIDVLDEEIARAERRLAAMEDEVGAMRSTLADVAVRRFVAGGASSNPLLASTDDLNAPAVAGVYAGAANGAAIVHVDDYDQAITDLDDARSDLQRQLDDATAARERFEQLKADAEDEIVRLTQIEEQRLRDVEVRKALERQRAERIAQERAAQEAQAASAAAAARQTPPAPAGSADLASQRPAAAPSAAAAPPPATVAPAAATPSSNDGEPASATTAAPAAPEPPPAAPPPATVAPVGPGIACPVAGPVAFADTWGAARSEGRRHEGVDMIAAHGTPLVAAEAGSASFRATRLGGNSISLQGASGTRYFYAHLSSWEGSSRGVSKGEVIGYVGSTGNTSVNHLHFEVHPGGGGAVNPYPYVRAAC